MSPCVLCGHASLRFCHRDQQRLYLACPRCALIQVPRHYWLSADAEKAVYDQHENDPQDAGYRRFLRRTAEVVCRRHPPGSQGLDFGCGPGPALIAMLEERGDQVWGYDHFYRPDASVLAGSYDYITATEVLEHLHDPGYWLDCLWHRLRPGGSLVLQTRRVTAPDHVPDWHYIRDPTHIHFFSIPTFRWLARRYCARVELSAPDVVALYPSDDAQTWPGVSG